MVSYYIGDGNTNLGSDPNSGDEFITVPVSTTGLVIPAITGSVTPFFQLDHTWDQGNFGFPFPANSRVYSRVTNPGSVRLLAGSPIALNVTPVLLLGGGDGEGFSIDAEITNPLIETPVVVLNGVQLDIFLQEAVVFAIAMPGEFPIFRVPPLTREFFAELLQVRPSTPWMVERVVKNIGEVVLGGVFQFPLNTPFLIHSEFSAETDFALWDLGARPNYIGMVVEVERPDGSIATAARFRAPEPFEVIVVRNP